MTRKARGLMGVLVFAAAVTAALVIVNRAPPDDAAPTCKMNDFGIGGCTFTNTDTLPWKMCGHVIVSKDARPLASSDSVCSGVVRPGTSVRVPFDVSGVSGVCPSVTWSPSTAPSAETCAFVFAAAR
jgi:hypothetical protein